MSKYWGIDPIIYGSKGITLDFSINHLLIIQSKKKKSAIHIKPNYLHIFVVIFLKINLHFKHIRIKKHHRFKYKNLKKSILGSLKKCMKYTPF